MATPGDVFAQQPSLQFFRPNSKAGLNVFEAPKIDTVTYEGVRVRVGGDFAMQFQGITQSNDESNLVELGQNLNLPSANLNIDVQLLDGVRMHLRTYLSARHHNEAWIKGGHMRIDKLDFIKPGFLSGIMEYTSITVGLDEFNYGDAHFRRSDNARAIFNPFVGNYIMDAFSTEGFGEVTVQKNGLLAVVGVTNGKLNQNVVVNANSDNKLSFFGKLGFDKQVNEDLRVRLTGSWYINNGTTTGTWLYGGDRGGARYYQVLHTQPDATGAVQGGNFDGRYNARFTKLTAIQINPFIKLGGLEFFGIYEVANGNNEFTQPQPDKEGAFTQVAGELLYRFGADERFYVGGRYNTISGKMRESATENLEISRVNVGGGWFISNNILTKVEYVQQSYNGNAWTGRFAGAEFSGINVEAVIAF
ncbi:hypothetical protein D770_02000 [Flammeovirgaceae bacterium 311]|nr:hypothetical protein D770_02000 [Flammeovirgaceae bacterium 311]